VSDKPKILVVDDEAPLRRILTTRLSMVGYQVVTAADGEQALDVFSAADPDLVVLDVKLPKLDGYAVCQQLRETSEVPIIMLSALSHVAERILGLQLGADDYISKPCSPKELEARIEAILRRVNPSTVMVSGVFCGGGLRIDFNKRQVELNEQRLRLTGMEFNLLQLLVKHTGEPLSRSELLQTVWGDNTWPHTALRIVDVHISRLRAKLGDDFKHPEFIHTDRGTGYFFHRFAAPGVEPTQRVEKGAISCPSREVNRARSDQSGAPKMGQLSSSLAQFVGGQDSLNGEKVQLSCLSDGTA